MKKPYPRSNGFERNETEIALHFFISAKDRFDFTEFFVIIAADRPPGGKAFSTPSYGKAENDP